MADSVSADALHLLRLILDTPWMRELSVAEQRYQAVLAVTSDGLSVSQVAEKVGVSRQTLHTWLARYEASGFGGLVDRSHRPGRVRIRCRLLWRRPCWSCAGHRPGVAFHLESGTGGEDNPRRVGLAARTFRVLGGRLRVRSCRARHGCDLRVGDVARAR